MELITKLPVTKKEGKQLFGKVIFLSVCHYCKNPELIVCDVDVQGWKPEDYPSAVYCGHCGIRGPWGKTEEEAVDKWNEISGTEKKDYSGWKHLIINGDDREPF